MKEESSEKVKSLLDDAKRQRERQHKRDLLKAWIGSRDKYSYYGQYTLMTFSWRKMVIREFIAWYNKQNF